MVHMIVQLCTSYCCEEKDITCPMTSHNFSERCKTLQTLQNFASFAVQNFTKVMKSYMSKVRSIWVFLMLLLSDTVFYNSERKINL